MKQNRIDQALSALGFALQEQQEQNPLHNPLAFVEKLPKRCFSGDHIIGGTVLKFKSSGITDLATSEQLVIDDDKVKINSLELGSIQGNLSVSGSIDSSGNVTAKSITADILNVKEIKADIQFEKTTPITFEGTGIGMYWTGSGYTKQFVFNKKPDRFFSSETIDLSKDKEFSIGGISVLSSSELGPTIEKSNLKSVGRLRGLTVDGSVSINNYLIYDGNTDRLGLGTDEPNGAFSIAEDGIELVFGTKDASRAYIGTYASIPLEVVTDNTARLTISAGGNIKLGNENHPPIQVSLHGRMSIGVSNPDPNVDLHVKGPVRFNDTTHLKGSQPPQGGTYNVGDIVWNSRPQQRSYIGWVCIRAGNPGIWSPFGDIR